MADAGVPTEQPRGDETPQSTHERQKKTARERFNEKRRSVQQRITGLTGYLRRIQESDPQVDLGQETDEADVLQDQQLRLDTEAVNALEPMRLQDMAIYRSLEPTFSEIDEKQGWRDRGIGKSYMDVIVIEDFIRGAKPNGPLAIAFGLDINHLSDGTWTGRSVSFEDSIFIDEALAQYMDNNAHIPLPIEYAKSLVGSDPILDAETWLTTLAEGHWPVAMQKRSFDGDEWVPFYHDETETHRAIMQYAPKSTQQLITQVAELDRARINDGRETVTLLEDGDGGSLYGRTTEGADFPPNSSGLHLLDTVSDNSLWVMKFEELLAAPQSQLAAAIQDVESFLKIDTAPVTNIADSSLLKGQITLLNYKIRETQGRNMTEDEVRTAARDYINELHTHLQTMRGSD